MDQESRQEDMRAYVDAEMSIEDYKVEPMTTQCMTDFYVFDHMTIDDIPSQVAGTNDANIGEAPRELPINYYDNDDGFWDDYILEKQGRWEDAGMIVNRRSFIH